MAPRAPAVPVTAATVETHDVPVVIEGIGNVQASSTVSVYSLLSGQIFQAHFKEGQEVSAGALLFTPQAEHQLFAKGIVYRREPFELVSLPLVKIYNLGEKDVSVADLAGLAAEGAARLHFLRKFDGTLVQRFQHGGRVYFTTRGMIEGGPAVGIQDEDAPERMKGFDFLGTARRLAEQRYPALCEPRPEFENLTLVFEFLHGLVFSAPVVHGSGEVTGIRY
jgi:hypothetical protein